MIYRLKLLFICCLFCAPSFAQTIPATSCGQQAVMQHFYATHPEYKAVNQQVEKLLAERNRALQSGALKTQRTAGIVTLPVVVHIIHNNGAENISDAQVLQGIQHLNEAYANSGYYDPADGVNTQIQFCMAQRDPSNNATNGITRDVSSYTVMGGATYYSDDQNVKNINRWNPLCYINIWLVKSIPTSVVGYAYLPSAHGSSVDGIIIEAAYFGSSYANDVVAAHEMGHYLGLYHTFEGGCTNNDCTADGDKVCDTPPDQSTAGISCTSSANSCSTDMLSGFATDQNDLTQDYMDYGNFNCMKVFTQGQADRMNWFIQNVRKSLLACKSCMNPCPAPVTADFNMPPGAFIAGSSYIFTNSSVNGGSFEWYVNGLLKSTGANLNYTFPATGNYNIKLLVHSGNALCDDAEKAINVNVVCGVNAGFTKSAITVAAGTNINFTNTSTGADNYEWYVNSVLQGATSNFLYTSSTAGDYIVQLVAKNSIAGCQQSFTDTVHYTCAVTAGFSPANTTTLINTPVNFTSTGTGATIYQWLVNGSAAGSGPSLSYTFAAVGAYTIQLVAGNGTCNASATGIIYVNDKCGNAAYLFQKTYAIGRNSTAADIRPTPDGGSIVAVRAIATGSSFFNACLAKLDAAGNTQWVNLYGNYTNSLFKKVKPTSDGGYVAIGQIQAAGTQGSVKTLIVKTDAAGDASWSKEITIVNAFSNYGSDILESADGSYYFTGAIEQPSINGSSDVLAGKLDGSGNLIWVTSFDNIGSETGNGLTEDNTHIIICGNKSGQIGNSGFLLQANKSDGGIVWAKAYQSTIENFLDIQATAGGYYVNALRTGSPAGIFSDHVFLKIDFTGKLTYSTYVQPFGAGIDIQGASISIKPNGNIVSQTSPAFGGTYADFIVQEIDPLTGNLWAKTYNKPSTWMSAISTAPGNGLWLAGYALTATSPAIDTYVMKLDSLGGSGSCPAIDAGPVLQVATYSTVSADFAFRKPQVQVNNNPVQQLIDAVSSTVCQYVKCDSVPVPVDTCKLCNTFHLSGADTICSFVTATSYSIMRSPGCPAVPQWRLADPRFGTLTITDDSTISIMFNRTGTTVLYATLHTGCTVLEDSITINIFQSPNKIDLGPDIQLCSTSTLKLNAGGGFASYLWNDGSVDSVLTAYNPGKYYVAATDYCGNTYSDTIIITQGPVVPFDLGPDLSKCNTDTLTIMAPAGFLSYTWAADYNISSITGASIQVWPALDTTYTVVAQVANGCTVIDTIRVKVVVSPGIHIGNDTSFCEGGSILLKAPGGFNNYTWQDGSSGNSFTAFQQGVYWLSATAANGCISRDTVAVKNVYPLPVHFLDVEAEICDGKYLELKALGNWPAYQWFNNSNSPSITINQAGHYWLQVTNADGCTARDTISVSNSKGCKYGIHFPNAFTPDHDNNNDTYKPIIFGLPINFRLVIYNRFGEKVFETTDYHHGWNGVYKGILQPTGAFVWYSVYQFEGAAAKIEKGSLILIR
jgi:gliding motility-associated-like protein